MRNLNAKITLHLKHYKEPIELYLLLGELLNAYDEAGLQPDATLKEAYLIKNPHIQSLKAAVPKFTRPKIWD